MLRNFDANLNYHCDTNGVSSRYLGLCTCSCISRWIQGFSNDTVTDFSCFALQKCIGEILLVSISHPTNLKFASLGLLSLRLLYLIKKKCRFIPLSHGKCAVIFFCVLSHGENKCHLKIMTTTIAFCAMTSGGEGGSQRNLHLTLEYPWIIAPNNKKLLIIQAWSFYTICHSFATLTMSRVK